LITAATKPQAIPVTAPRTAARRRAEAGDRRRSPNAIASPASTAASVINPASHHREAGACGRPPDGDAASRSTPSPADMAAAASQSRRVTRPPPRTVM
jgi:hypothetical protein